MSKITNSLKELSEQLINIDRGELANKVNDLHKYSGSNAHKTQKEAEEYHAWLKLPENWNNEKLVSYLIKDGKPVLGPDDLGLMYRNCNECDSTLAKRMKKKK